MIRPTASMVVLSTAFIGSVAAAKTVEPTVQKASIQIVADAPAGDRRALEVFAECLVSQTPEPVKTMLDLPVDSDEYVSQFHSLYTTQKGACISSSGFEPLTLTFRGALFQALYAKHFGANAPDTFTRELDTKYRSKYGASLSTAARPVVLMAGLGECVSRAAGATVKALLRTQPGTKTEASYFEALIPIVQGCLLKDMKMTFTQTVLRGSLAEGMYRLAVAARDGGDN